MSTLRQQWTLPILEASALTLRPNSAGAGVEVVAVADDRYEIARAEVSGAGVLVATRPNDVAPFIGQLGAGGSDFEGVASDSSRRLFVLQEGASRIVVFNPDLASVAHQIALVVKRNEPGIGKQWRAQSNSRGEGLLLLRNGHLLIAKQKDDPWLIEFGPAGESAAGFSPGDAVGPGETFSLDHAVTRFEVLASWPLAPGTPLRSLNDLAVDGVGRLWVISSVSRRLARLKNELRPGGEPAAFEVVPLPAELFADDDDRAEGLVNSADLGWLVAVDHRRNAANLFQLGDVPA